MNSGSLGTLQEETVLRLLTRARASPPLCVPTPYEVKAQLLFTKLEQGLDCPAEWSAVLAPMHPNSPNARRSYFRIICAVGSGRRLLQPLWSLRR